MSNKCVCCGELIPEGRQVCPQCESKVEKMTRLIDANSLLEKIQCRVEAKGIFGAIARDVVEQTREIIMREPTVSEPHWATEAAYKNGYEQGKKDALKWIPVTERLPKNFVSVLGYMTDAGRFPPVRECFTVGNAFFFPALGDKHPVSHWCEIPTPTKEEEKC